MKLDINEITTTDKNVGRVFWICDYRQPDINKKAIRHLRPTEAMLVSNDNLPENKTIYYSNNHFRAMNAKGGISATPIPVFDNTGYRSNSGTPIAVFDNEQECINFYNEQIDTIVAMYDEHIASIQQTLTNARNSVAASRL